MRLVDILPLDVAVAIGAYEFTPERIVAFAKKYDPHFFHVDEEAAKASLFGGLCASGWHVCSAAMGRNVAHMQAEAARIAAEGAIAPKLGPSPGVKDLKWLKPVFAGDSVSYFQRYLGDRLWPGKSDRQVCSIAFEGVNQSGDMVMRFEGSVIEFL